MCKAIGESTSSRDLLQLFSHISRAVCDLVIRVPVLREQDGMTAVFTEAIDVVITVIDENLIWPRTEMF